MALIKGFKNPKTKEQDVVDLDAVQDIVLLPVPVIKSGDTHISRISYKLVRKADTSTVSLQACYSLGNTVLTSIQTLSDEAFAHQLAAAYYKHMTVDMMPWIYEAKRAAKASICEQLLEYNCILSEATFLGIGLITAQHGQRTTIIDRLRMVPLINGTTLVTLHDCVGYDRLEKIRSPVIVFYGDTYQITLDVWTVIEDADTDLRDIKLSVSSFSFVKPCVIPADLQTALQNSTNQEAFISERRAFLNVSTAPRLGFFF